MATAISVSFGTSAAARSVPMSTYLLFPNAKFSCAIFWNFSHCRWVRMSHKSSVYSKLYECRTASCVLGVGSHTWQTEWHTATDYETSDVVDMNCHEQRCQQPNDCNFNSVSALSIWNPILFHCHELHPWFACDILALYYKWDFELLAPWSCGRVS